uniref:ABC transporter G family member 20 n=1 Tax=Aceria tosichella TaxID=561515 RepID=A0A6G1SIZ5_9ACAR
MFGESDDTQGRVRPLRFKSIDDDNDDQNPCSNHWHRRPSKKRSAAKSFTTSNEHNNINMMAMIHHEDHTNNELAKKARKRLSSSPPPPPVTTCESQQQPPQLNFSLEYSYPAVILENICFSVDRSQQQSNFLNECLSRLSQCVNPILCACDKQHQPDQSQKVQILKSVNLNVPHGTIFGLLGPSSCGKTTLLRCLVGLLKPNSGSIRLFGRCSFSKLARQQHHQNNSDDNETKSSCCHCLSCQCDNQNSQSNSGRNDCKVPGSNVGYMPQDLGLYEDFTISQLLTMFGNYMRMDSKLIKDRIAFMANFLDLPDVDRVIATLSGGQKRRVSFAIALLHMPPLIILDEPTVGVDPLLRRSIWKYLRCLASEENKTIIITTHYIEEAAQADQVALMRAGEILVQDSPQRIMQSNNSRTLEEAFLKICNNVQSDGGGGDNSANTVKRNDKENQNHNSNNKLKIIAQPKFHWPAELDNMGGGGAGTDSVCATSNDCPAPKQELEEALNCRRDGDTEDEEAVDPMIRELKLKAQEKLAIYDKLRCNQLHLAGLDGSKQGARGLEQTNLSMTPDAQKPRPNRQARLMSHILDDADFSGGASGGGHHNHKHHQQQQQLTTTCGKTKRDRLFRKNKFVLNDGCNGNNGSSFYELTTDYFTPDSDHRTKRNKKKRTTARLSLPMELASDDDDGDWRQRISKGFALFWALLYKNYRRNVNSIPLLAFQFMLPMIQMISFSLCVGGKPTNVGLGIVNHDNPISYLTSTALVSSLDNVGLNNATIGGGLVAPSLNDEMYLGEQNDSLSLRYMSFIDTSMLNVKIYNDLGEALADVRRAKLWAALEIGENFTAAIEKRFDLENFYQLDLPTIHQSVIKLYPDRSNKILDMICHRSLVDSYRRFLSDEFEHFKRLPIEIARPIFDIKPNVISNSIDGYTESIAPGLLASLTYIMAAGLTTFIMVVERSAGILERTYTSGIHPIAYLLAHAIFRSVVMMFQIGFVLGLTFYILKQPLVGSIWLAYFMLMTLNVTGIAYGLLISSIVTDQNGAALTIVSSLVVKITLSGILWPFEAIPMWLRTICYIQPLTMPVQALKAITLKGAVFGDRAVNLGFLVSISWLIVFLTISAKRFKFYQH